MIQKFADGDLTTKALESVETLARNSDKEAKNELLKLNFTGLNVKEIADYLEQHDGTAQFAEGIKKFAQVKGCADCGDPKKLKKFLVRCYKEKGINYTDPTLRSWINGESSPDPGNADCRCRVFELCFALGLNEIETAELFLKYYFDRPYNFKDAKEACYYFCLKNNLSFQEAENIAEEIQKDGLSQSHGCTQQTIQIGEHISACQDISAFMSYMKEHCFSQNSYNAIAAAKIEELMSDCMEFFKNGNNSSKDSEKELFLNIYGDEIDHLFESMPKRISESIFIPQQLTLIRNKKASSQAYRKALILLQFYSYFRALEDNIEEYNPEESYNEFEEQLDGLLAECGYLQHYWRNPFDCLVLYCAKSKEPLDAFHDIMARFFYKAKEK